MASDSERATLLKRRTTRSEARTAELNDGKVKVVPGVGVALMKTRTDVGHMVAFQEGHTEQQAQEEHEAEDDEEEQVKKRPEIPKIFGLDQRPFFPCALVFSFLWSMWMTSAQAEVCEEIFGLGWHTSFFFMLLYCITFYAFAYTALWNPGTLDDESYNKYLSNPEDAPERSKKYYLYKRPVKRFHQYCRWITNCVGLYNHREYMIMLFGFFAMGTVDAFLDLIHIPVRLFQGGLLTLGLWIFEIILGLHCAYSAYLAYYVAHLLRLHVGFIVRNELTEEWKKDEFYIIYDKLTGEPKAVADLDDDEFDENFNHFIYDKSRNKFDKGWYENCMAFWLTPRKAPGQNGEF